MRALSHLIRDLIAIGTLLFDSPCDGLLGFGDLSNDVADSLDGIGRGLTV